MLNKGITIKARIGLTMAFLAMLLVALGVFGLFGMSRSDDAYKDTFTNAMPGAVNLGNAEMYAARERLALDRAAFEAGTPEAATTVERARMLRGVSDSFWRKYLDLPRNAEEDRLAQDVAAKRSTLQQRLDAFAAAITANDQSKLVEDARNLQVAFNDLVGADDALRKFQFESAQQGYDSAQRNFGTFRIVSIAALLAGALAAVLSYLTLSRAIARPLEEALGHLDAIAAGDLRRPVSVTSRDEMGQLLHGIARMQRSLTETVRSVRGGSESIATATRQIAAGNVDLSSRTEEQASALQETASSMEQLTGTVRQNADNARQASALAANASEIANRGSAVVGQVVGTMGDINQSSAKIADIISIIEGEIIGAVQRVTDIMGEIAAASEEQSGGIDQVARAVTQMDEVTQQNAALVEEAAAAASSLEEQAARLRHAVAVFQVDDSGRGAHDTAPALARPKRAVAASRLAPHAPKPAQATAPAALPAKAPAANAAARAPQPVTAPAPARAPARPAATAGSDQDWETF
jgi:methyl-accepting chemotaxis protein-1 (serine sensor receptor)